VAVQNSAWYVLVWSIRTKQSINSKLHLMPMTFELLHSLFLQTGNLPSSSCVSIRIFSLTSQIDTAWCRLCCFMGYSEIALWSGFPPYWRPWGDFVDRRFLERGFGINQIYFFFSMNLRNLHNTQEAGQWWTFRYETLIMFFFHSHIFP
jgi:hypothetical protein